MEYLLVSTQIKGAHPFALQNLPNFQNMQNLQAKVLDFSIMALGDFNHLHIGHAERYSGPENISCDGLSTCSEVRKVLRGKVQSKSIPGFRKWVGIQI